MVYRKINRISAHGYSNYIPNFKEVFPELKSVGSEEMAKRWRELKIEFYSVQKDKVSLLLRLSIIFALILFLFMFISLPFNYIITGNWGYDPKNTRIYNWFKALNIVK